MPNLINSINWLSTINDNENILKQSRLSTIVRLEHRSTFYSTSESFLNIKHFFIFFKKKFHKSLFTFFTGNPKFFTLTLLITSFLIAEFLVRPNLVKMDN